MIEDKDIQELSTEELIALYEKYSSTPSNPLSSFMASKIRKELESRGVPLGKQG
ncbi:MAG: hypothetical protein GX562_00265 [Coriobacteriaceae bacterium]|nr:hypothetical protein [Coriobacteriaceae bacterium]